MKEWSNEGNKSREANNKDASFYTYLKVNSIKYVVYQWRYNNAETVKTMINTNCTEHEAIQQYKIQKYNNTNMYINRRDMPLFKK